jgi:hypothetical protein
MARYTEKKIRAALIECKGMVYIAAQRLGCSLNTIKARVAKSRALQETLDAARGMTGDTAELKLYQAIQEGEPWAIQFYLKTQCKTRGYSEKVEIDFRDLDAAIERELAELTGQGEGAAAAPIIGSPADVVQ